MTDDEFLPRFGACAFTRLIADRARPNEDFAAFRERHGDLFDRTLIALVRHYSKELLESPAARSQFVEPDLEDLVLNPSRGTTCFATPRVD